MSSIDPSRYDEGRPDALCTCGHPLEDHIGMRLGWCICAWSTDGWCPQKCRSFAYDATANREKRAVAEHAKRQYDKIETVAPFIDAGPVGKGWMPSELLTIGYAAIATGPMPQNAEPFLDGVIAEARRRYRSGLYANPFANEPMVRP